MSRVILVLSFYFLFCESLAQAADISTKSDLQRFFDDTYLMDKEDSYDLFVDLEHDKDVVKREYLLNHAIDNGYNLKWLEIYGLKKVGKKSYFVDMSKHKDWIKISDVMLSYSDTEEIKARSEQLQSMGLSEHEVQELIDYVELNDINIVVAEAVLKFVKKYRYLKGGGKASEKKYNLFEMLVKELHFVREDAYRDWSLNLLDRFSGRSKRILYEYSIGIPRSKTISEDDYSREEKVRIFMESYFSGEWEKALEKQLQQLRRKKEDINYEGTI